MQSIKLLCTRIRLGSVYVRERTCFRAVSRSGVFVGSRLSDRGRRWKRSARGWLRRVWFGAGSWIWVWVLEWEWEWGWSVVWVDAEGWERAVAPWRMTRERPRSKEVHVLR